MPTYTAFFYTSADWAKITFKADTPELALQRAHQIENEEAESLDFASYHDGTDGVDHIEIWAPDRQTVAEWRSDDLLLRLAAADLLEALVAQTDAAQAVIDSWCDGDLAGAVRQLDAGMSAAKLAIAKAKGGAA